MQQYDGIKIDRSYLGDEVSQENIYFMNRYRNALIPADIERFKKWLTAKEPKNRFKNRLNISWITPTATRRRKWQAKKVIRTVSRFRAIIAKAKVHKMM